MDSALVQLLSVFAGMLVLSRLKMPLGLCLLGGGIVLHAWADGPAMLSLRMTGLSLLQIDLWLLAAVIALVVELGHFIAREENARLLLQRVQRWGGQHGRAVSLMSIPAIIGLFPMPGGALFSAPFVGQTVHETSWRPAWKTAMNYWFRHIWEFWWPLYPVVILTLSLFDIPAWKFTVMQLPLTVVSCLVGYLLLVRPLAGPLRTPVAKQTDAPGSLWRIALPLLTVLLSALLFPSLLNSYVSWSSQTVKLTCMAAGLLTALLITVHGQVRQLRPALQRLTHRKHLNLQGILIGVMSFQFMLSHSSIMARAGEELLASHIPLVAAVILLPFLAGLVTGIAIGFAGAAFPLVAGFITQDGSTLTLMPTLFLAYISGYAGMMLSPLHLCFIVSNEYFESSFRQVYRYIAPCAAALLLSGFLMYAVMKLAGF